MPFFTPYKIYEIIVDDIRVGTLVYREGSDEDHYYDGHIAYTIEEEYRGHHYAYKACLLLKSLLSKEGINHVIITCDPDNIASRKTIEALGATFIEQATVPKKLRRMFAAGETVKNIYRWEV